MAPLGKEMALEECNTHLEDLALMLWSMLGHCIHPNHKAVQAPSASLDVEISNERYLQCLSTFGHVLRDATYAGCRLKDSHVSPFFSPIRDLVTEWAPTDDHAPL